MIYCKKTNMALYYITFAFVCFGITQQSIAEKLDGENIIGAIIPIHTSGPTCANISTQSVAVAEAMKLAIDTINNKKSILGSASFTRTMGYDLRDSCGDIEKAKDIAYDFNRVYRAYKRSKQGDKPVSTVLARFDRDESAIMELIAFEELPQLSYARDNNKLRPAKVTRNDKFLFSMHPGDYYKLKAAVAIIKSLKIEFVSLVVSNTKQARAGMSVIMKEFNSNIDSCHSDEYVVDSVGSVKKVISKLKQNSIAKVVVLQLGREESLMMFKEAQEQNLTGIIWFSTVPWKDNMEDLKPYDHVIEGMIVIDNEVQEATGFKLHLSSLKRPYDNSLQKLFLELGGPKECLGNGTKMSANTEQLCGVFEKKMMQEILKYKADAAYTIDAVYAFAHAIQNKAKGKKFVDDNAALMSVDFISPLTSNIVKFNQDGVVIDSISVIYNMQRSLTDPLKMELIKCGTYDNRQSTKLALNKKVLRWSNGTDSVPVSKCSPDCLQGSRRIAPKSGPLCCWTCEPCSNGTASGSNNSASCTKCGKLQVANPGQTACVNFKTVSFNWFEPFGEFMIFFITAGACVVFFTLGIFSQNRECDVVKSADYTMMVFMLIGLFLCFFTPVPLLLTPTPGTCITYVIMFNFGLTIPLATLFTKSAAVRHYFFDENMDLKHGILGSKPHFIVVGAVLAVQTIILAIGVRLAPSNITYHETKQWDVKYAECSYVKNGVFWVSFSYNVILSLVLTLLSYKTVKMTEDFKELKFVSITTCCFYFMSCVFITSIYSVFGKHVVEAASILIVIFGFMFLITYFLPKLRLILYHQPKKELGPDGKPLIAEDEQAKEDKISPHISGIAAFGKVRVLAVKVKSKDGDKEPIASGSNA